MQGRDFAEETSKRRLFPHIEPDIVPSPENEPALRAAIAHLHRRILGRADEADVGRTYALFTGIVEEAKARGKFEDVDIYHCKLEGEKRVPDPEYTIRAWRAVVT